MIDWTLCGFCYERIPCESSGVPKEHNCRTIQDLKKKVDLTLSEIQKDFNNKLQEINGTLRNHRSLNAHLEGEIAKLKRELSSCIDVKLLYSDRQARESWQQGCDEMISSIIQRIADMDLMFKQAFICVDNSHVNDAAKYYGLAPVAQLNKIAKEVPHHPSLKHLENKLREKNVKLKELEAEINTLEYKLKYCCCPNEIRTWAGANANAEKYLGLAPVAQLNKIVNEQIYSKIAKEGDKYILKTQNFPFEEEKIHHPSRKHLENKLRQKNKEIKNLTEKNIELEHKVTELLVACRDSNAMRERVVELSKHLQDANTEIHLLKNPFNGGCK